MLSAICLRFSLLFQVIRVWTVCESAAHNLNASIDTLGLPSLSIGGLGSIKESFSSNCLELLILNPAYFLVPSLFEPWSFARRLNEPSSFLGSFSPDGKSLSSSLRNSLPNSLISSS